MSRNKTVFVGIIIVNYNTIDELFACLDSIREHVQSNFRIYVVENGSIPEVRDAVVARCANFDDVEVIVSEKNLGYSGGNNLGVKKAIEDGATHLAVVNSDIVFVNDALSIMVDDIEGDVVAAGPRVVTLDEDNGQIIMPTYSYFAALCDRQPFYTLRRIASRLFHFGFDYDRRYVFDGMVCGCCFLIDAARFAEVGFFDDNVFLYSEERILSIKLAEKGYRACYDPRAIVLHMEGRTTAASGNAFADYHRYASDYYTVSRYCNSSKARMMLLRALRLGAFRIKAIRDDQYKEYCRVLKSTYDALDAGSYKIEPSVIHRG